jgi:hypothetical protein
MPDEPVADDPAAPERDGGYAGSRAERLVLGCGLALGVLATVLAILGESTRLLRVGVLAALWAALIGGYLAARYRRDVAAGAAELAALRSRAELAARRDDESADQQAETLAAVRSEVAALRGRLDEFVDGEVLVERIGMLAETTRMRRIADPDPDPVPAPLEAAQQNVNGDHPVPLPGERIDPQRARHGGPAADEEPPGAHSSGVSVADLLGRGDNEVSRSRHQRG